MEIVTLLIPGFNDSDDELKRLAEFVAGVSPDIPWHVTAFHKDYKMTDPSEHQPRDFNAVRRRSEGQPDCGSFTRGICRAWWAIWKTRAAPVAKLC